MLSSDVTRAAVSLYDVVTTPFRHRVRKEVPTPIVAFAECGHCHETITSYFIDGYGRMTCKKCKPEGWEDAIKRKAVKF